MRKLKRHIEKHGRHVHKHVVKHHKKYLIGGFGVFGVIKAVLLVLGFLSGLGYLVFASNLSERYNGAGSNNSPVDQTFWDINAPELLGSTNINIGAPYSSTGDVVDVYYGHFVGDPAKDDIETYYTSGWVNYTGGSCLTKGMGVEYLEPGEDKIPLSLVEGTIYVLSSGVYYSASQNHTIIFDHCSALVGEKGVKIDATDYPAFNTTSKEFWINDILTGHHSTITPESRACYTGNQSVSLTTTPVGSYVYYAWLVDNYLACYDAPGGFKLNGVSSNTFDVPDDNDADYKPRYVCYYSSGGGVQESTRVSGLFDRDNASPVDVTEFTSPGATIAQDSTVVCDWGRPSDVGCATMSDDRYDFEFYSGTCATGTRTDNLEVIGNTFYDLGKLGLISGNVYGWRVLPTDNLGNKGGWSDCQLVLATAPSGCTDPSVSFSDPVEEGPGTGDTIGINYDAATTKKWMYFSTKGGGSCPSTAGEYDFDYTGSWIENTIAHNGDNVCFYADMGTGACIVTGMSVYAINIGTPLGPEVSQGYISIGITGYNTPDYYYDNASTTIRANIGGADIGRGTCEYSIDDGVSWIDADENSGSNYCYKGLGTQTSTLDIKFRIESYSTSSYITGSSREYIYDNTGPSVPNLQTITGGTQTTDTTPPLTWTDADDDGIGLKDYMLYVDDTAGCGSPEYSYITINPSKTVTDNLSVGTWYWKVVARDDFDNLATPSDCESFKVISAGDNTKPVVENISPVNNTEYTISNNVPFVWSGSDAVGITSYTLYIGYGTGLLGGYAAGTDTGKIVNLPNDRYEWRVEAEDAAGNTGESQAWQIIVSGAVADTTPPPVPTMNPEPSYGGGTTNIVRSNTVIDGEGSGPVEYQFCIDTDDDVAGCTVGGWDTSTGYTFSSLVNGQIYYYFVQARDSLENTSVWSNSVSSTQDTMSPDVPTLSCSEFTHNVTGSYDGVVDCDIDDTSNVSPRSNVYYSINSGTNWVSNSNNLGFSFTPLEGVSDVIMRISDVGGSEYSNTYIIKKDLGNPCDGHTYWWDNSNFITGAFWAHAPDSCDVVAALYGTSVNDVTAYTENWSGYDGSCSVSGNNMTIVYKNNLQTPTNGLLLENIIYVLGTGSYDTANGSTGWSVNGKCSSVVGTGDVFIHSWKQIINTGMINNSGFDYTILDSLKIYGDEDVDPGSSHPINDNGIKFNNVDNFTINDVTVKGTLEAIDLSSSNYGLISNYVGYDNRTAISWDASDYNILRNSELYNNSNNGVYGGKFNYNIIDNVLIYNNDFGINVNRFSFFSINNTQIFSAGNTALLFENVYSGSINNTQIYNSNAVGVKFQNAEDIVFNDVSVYNNHFGISVDNTSTSKYYGTLTMFDNDTDFDGDTNGADVYFSGGLSTDTAVSSLGRSDGSIYSDECMTCDWYTNPQNSLGVFMMNTGTYPGCTGRNLAAWTGTDTVNYLYGGEIAKQYTGVVFDGSSLIYSDIFYDASKYIGEVNSLGTYTGAYSCEVDIVGPDVGTGYIYSGNVVFNQYYYYNGIVDIKADVTDVDGISGNTCEYTVDNSNRNHALYSGTSKTGYCYMTGIFEGDYININFRVRDLVGNIGTGQNRFYLYDIDGPTTGNFNINGNYSYSNTGVVDLIIASCPVETQSVSPHTKVGLSGMYISNNPLPTSGDYFSECTSGMIITEWSLSGDEGINTVYMVGVDKLGNTGDVVSDQIELDTIKPLIGATNSSAYWQNEDVVITLNVSDDNFSGAWYSWTGGDDCRDGTGYSSGDTIDVTTNGEYILYLCANDYAGNTGAWSGEYKLDTINPTVSLQSPISGFVFDTGTVELEWSGFDNGSSIFGYTLYVNSILKDHIIGDTGFLLSGLVDGDYTWYVLAIDVASNTRVSNIKGFKVDTVGPNISTGYIYSGNVVTGSNYDYYNGTVDIKADVTDVDGISGDTCEYTLSGSSWYNALYSGTSKTGYCYVTGLNVSLSMGVAFRVKDLVGNISTGAYRPYIYDNTGPTTGDFNINDNALYVNTGIVDLTIISCPVEVRDTQRVGLSGMYISNNPNPTSGDLFSECTGGLVIPGWSLSGDEGSNIVYMRGVDKLGNMGEVVSDEITLDTTNPDVTLRTPTSGEIIYSNTIGFDWTGFDANGISGYDLYITGDEQISLTGLIATGQTLSLDNGDYRWHIVSTDMAGNTGMSEVGPLVVSGNMYGPELIYPIEGTGVEYGTLSLLRSGISNSGYTYTIANNNVFSSVFTSGTLDYTGIDLSGLSILPGNYFWKVVNNETNGVSGYAEFNIVDTAIPAIDLVSPGSGSTVLGNTVNFEWSGSDNVGIESYELYITGADTYTKTGLTLTGQSIDLGNGNYSWYVIVEDTSGNTGMSETRPLIVSGTLNSSEIPELILPEDDAIVEMSGINLEWSGSSASGYLWRVATDEGYFSNVVASGTTNSGTLAQLLSHNPAFMTGEYYWKVTDMATKGVSAGRSFNILEQENPAVTLVSPGNGTTVGGNTVSFEWSGSDNVGVESYELYIDGINGTSYTTGIVDIVLTGIDMYLANGDYAWYVIAKDAGSNTGISDTRWVVIDGDNGVPPTIVFTGVNPDVGADINYNYMLGQLQIAEGLKGLGLFEYEFDGISHSVYDTGLILMMNFDDIGILGESISSVVTDLSIYNNTGAVDGAIWIENGKWHGAYEFDGADDYIDISGFDMGMSGISVGLWFKTDSGDSGMVLIGLGTGDGYVNSIGMTGGRIAYSSDSVQIETIETYDDNNWHLLVVDSIDQKIYIDGVDVQTGSTTYNISTNRATIGAKYDSSYSQFFDGQIDELRIYDRVLTKDYIQFLYRSNLNKYDDGMRLFDVKNTCLLDGMSYSYTGRVASIIGADYMTGRTVTTDIVDFGLSGFIDYSFTGMEVSNTGQMITGQYEAYIELIDLVAKTGFDITIQFSDVMTGFEHGRYISGDNFYFESNDLDPISGIVSDDLFVPEGIQTGINITVPQSYMVKLDNPDDFMCNGGVYGDKPKIKLNLPAYQVLDKYMGILYVDWLN